MAKKLVLRTIYGKSYSYKGFTELELEDILFRIVTLELKEWEIVNG